MFVIQQIHLNNPDIDLFRLLPFAAFMGCFDPKKRRQPFQDCLAYSTYFGIRKLTSRTLVQRLLRLRMEIGEYTVDSHFLHFSPFFSGIHRVDQN